MKILSYTIIAFVFLAGSNLFAQNKKNIEHPDRNRDDLRYHNDGSYSFADVDAMGNDVRVVVEPRMPVLPDMPWDDVNSPMYVQETNEMDITRNFKGPGNGNGGGNGGGGNGGGAVTVNVYAFADEEYRAANGNWESKIGGIIEKADNAYGRDQNINWEIVGYYEWNSNGNSASRLLSDLSNESSGLGPGLVMGFTADSNFEAGGIAYVYNSNPGTGVSVCVDQGTTWTTYALRHEIGHNYSCSHDFDPVVCLMNYTYAYSIDYFDPAHEAEIDAHRNWFQ